MAKFGDWDKLLGILGEFDERLSKNARKGLLRMGEELASDIRERILDSKDMLPLHPATQFIKREKGGDKPLMDQGDLLGSIAPQETGPLEVTVGVHRMAADGTNVAAIHEREDGTVVPVTERMRAFLHSRGFHLKPSTKALFIPGRPFMAPAYKDFRERGVPEGIAIEVVEAVLEGKG